MMNKSVFWLSFISTQYKINYEIFLYFRT